MIPKRRRGAIVEPRWCLVVVVGAFGTLVHAQEASKPARVESPGQWFRDGADHVARAKQLSPQRGRAKNVILFVGDGMGVATVTAARILEGQLRGEPGEENLLFFETLPYGALVKTYSTDHQTPDSAGTMTAMVTGVKTRSGYLSVDQTADRGAVDIEGHRLATILELAERAGLATGVVTTTSITHATPGACYAHTTMRGWEDDSQLPPSAIESGFPDIASQLLAFQAGDGLDVVLGGGRRHLLPVTQSDPEYKHQTGSRRDGRDLVKEWLRKPNASFVWNLEQFNAIPVDRVGPLLGVFERRHMRYEHDRSSDASGEPSLSQMTSTAIDILARGDRGFFLMVEGGRIDHAHHDANAFRALTETIEFANAVKTAHAKTRHEDTLIVVTADHSHVMTISGYAARGHSILGLSTARDPVGGPHTPARDATGLPYATLSYANGPGYAGASEAQPEGPKHRPHSGAGYRPASARPDLSTVDTTSPDYLQECMVPRWSETHGGEDVPLYADGPGAHLFHGVIEQQVIFHVCADALGLKPVAPK